MPKGPHGSHCFKATSAGIHGPTEFAGDEFRGACLEQLFAQKQTKKRGYVHGNYHQISWCVDIHQNFPITTYLKGRITSKVGTLMVYQSGPLSCNMQVGMAVLGRSEACFIQMIYAMMCSDKIRFMRPYWQITLVLACQSTPNCHSCSFAGSFAMSPFLMPHTSVWTVAQLQAHAPIGHLWHHHAARSYLPMLAPGSSTGKVFTTSIR